MTKTAKDALRKLISLKMVARETGVITNRAQREVLKSLSPEDLIEVAQAIYPAVGFKKTLTEVAK